MFPNYKESFKNVLFMGQIHLRALFYLQAKLQIFHKRVLQNSGRKSLSSQDSFDQWLSRRFSMQRLACCLLEG